MKCLTNSLFVLILISLSQVCSADEISFSEVLSSNGKLKILGSFKKNTEVKLLYKNSTICNAKTHSLDSIEHPFKPIDATLLKKSKCSSKDILIAVINSSISSFSYFKPIEIEDLSILRKAASKASIEEHPNTPDHFIIFKDKGIILDVSNKQNKIQIVQLQRKVNKRGPLLILQGNNIYPLKGECTANIETFYLNTTIHLSYTQTGCNSGISIKRIIKVDKKGITQVYYNPLWST